MKKYFTPGNVALTIIIAILLFFTYLITSPFVRYYSSPRHDVYVEWTVYTASGPRNYSGTYNMVGDHFGSMHMSHRGTNKVCIRRTNVHSYIGDESVCIYTGTSDVDVNKIKVIK